MDAAEISQALDNVFDQGVEYHGFTDYMRDYELIAYCTADPRTGIQPEHLRLVFQMCVYATVETSVRADVWPRSLDDRLIDYDTGADLDGYVWGVKWQELYPGAALVPNSARAAQWSEHLGIAFHEVGIAMNAHRVSLVFADLAVHVVEPGYRPYVVGASGPDFKIPLP